MKKFLSLCLMAMTGATMMGAELPFTVDPASGSTVASLEAVTLTLTPDSGYEYFEVNTKDDVYFTLNNKEYCAAICSTATDGELTITPAEPIEKDGVYSLVIMPYAISWANSEDYTKYGDNEEKIELTYTVGEGGGETPSELPFRVTDPEPGSTVTGLYYVLLELYQDSGYTSFVINNEKGIYFSKDDAPLYAAVCMPEGFNLEIDPEKFITGAGKYSLVIEEGALAWTNGEEKVSNSEKLVYNYTVEKGEASLPFEVTPEPGHNVASLSEITLKLKPEEGYTTLFVDEYSVGIMKGTEFAGALAVTQDPNDATSWVMTIVNDNDEPTPITEPGTYDLVIDEWGVYCTSEDGLFYANESALFFTYTVGESNVALDVVPTSYKPADGSEIDFDMRDFDSVTLNVEEGIMPSEDAVAYITPIGFEEEAIEAKIEKVNSMNQLIIRFEPMMYNGEYEVYIPEASFGDEAWIADPQSGHANPEIILTYTLINAAERTSNVSYTLQPEVTYSADYKSFTLKFDEGVQMGEFAFATFSCTEASYSKYAVFTDNGDSTFTVEFDEAPTEAGNYLFVVDRGMFGDAEYIESGEESGVANAAVEMLIEFKGAGIGGINAEKGAAPVYNLFGVKVADTVDNLPSGIYIVGGKKIVVR